MRVAGGYDDSDAFRFFLFTALRAAQYFRMRSAIVRRCAGVRFRCQGRRSGAGIRAFVGWISFTGLDDFFRHAASGRHSLNSSIPPFQAFIPPLPRCPSPSLHRVPYLFKKWPTISFCFATSS